MITITEAKLRELQACEEGIVWFATQQETEIEPLCTALIADEKGEWVNWLLTELMSKEQRVKYAIFAAEQVLHIFEHKYPNDQRPRNAIEAAKAYLADPSAASAAWAAGVAASVTWGASAASAAWAAGAAASVTWGASAASAAWAAGAAASAAGEARKDMQTRLANFSIKLLRGEE